MKYILKYAFTNAIQWTGKNYNELLELTESKVVFSEHSGLLHFSGDAWVPVVVGSFFWQDPRTGYCSAMSEDEFIARYEVAE
jgi:hypothetical protein